MRLLNKLERKFGRFAIKNLMLYIIIGNIIVYFLLKIQPTETVYKLSLIPYLIKQGEIWRLITFIFFPMADSPLTFAIKIYLYYLIGTTLENEWGSFKFGVYYLIGMVSTIAGAFIADIAIYNTMFLNLSLFLAFARIYPDFELMMFFVLPVKMKYLALINLGYFVLTIIGGNTSYKVAAIAALVNYLIFFGPDIVTGGKYNASNLYRKKQYESNFKNINKKYHHQCTVCKRTELDDKELEFRYCSKCEGYYEYCMDHLHNHEHIREN